MSENKKPKIIIVDDDEFLVDMYATKFSNSNIDTEICRSGEELFEKLKQDSEYSLILLDIVIPMMNGIEILLELRKQKLAESVPVVMLTNQNDKDDIENAKNLGVSGYIVKSSATPSEVVEKVLEIIKK